MWSVVIQCFFFQFKNQERVITDTVCCRCCNLYCAPMFFTKIYCPIRMDWKISQIFILRRRVLIKKSINISAHARGLELRNNCISSNCFLFYLCYYTLIIITLATFQNHTKHIILKQSKCQLNQESLEILKLQKTHFKGMRYYNQSYWKLNIVNITFYEFGYNEI